MAFTIDALLRVKGGREIDLNEWLDYHRAIGFDHIYVFIEETPPWWESFVRKHSDVRFINASQKWSSWHEIGNAYAKHHSGESWAVMLGDSEYIYVDSKGYGTLRNFISTAANGCDAVSVFTKYISSASGMRNRVGSMIDCFTHVRKDPEGSAAKNDLTPNDSVMFFKILGGVLPLAGRNVSVSGRWLDSHGVNMSASRVHGQESALSYPVRCYNYALRSGAESGFAPGTNPVGYAYLDMAMQTAREKALGIPANCATETAFAKNSGDVPADEIWTPAVPMEETSSLPVTVARIDREILCGKRFPAVLDLMRKRDDRVNEETARKVYDHEVEMIKTGSPVYAKFAEMHMAGMDPSDIADAIGVHKEQIGRMKAVAEALGLLAAGNGRPKEYPVDAVKIESIVAAMPTGPSEEKERLIDPYPAVEAIAAPAPGTIQKAIGKTASVKKKRVSAGIHEAKPRKKMKKIKDVPPESAIPAAPTGVLPDDLI